MSTYFVTFDSNTTLAKHFVRVEADIYGDARTKVFQVYGTKWNYNYDEKAWSRPNTYRLIGSRLTAVPFGTPNHTIAHEEET